MAHSITQDSLVYTLDEAVEVIRKLRGIDYSAAQLSNLMEKLEWIYNFPFFLKDGDNPLPLSEFGNASEFVVEQATTPKGSIMLLLTDLKYRPVGSTVRTVLTLKGMAAVLREIDR